MNERALSEQSLDTAGAVDIAQAALRLGISMQTLVTLLEHGFLKGYKAEDGRWKVLLEAAEAAAATLGAARSEPQHEAEVLQVPPAEKPAIDRADALPDSSQRPAARPAALVRPSIAAPLPEQPPVAAAPEATPEPEPPSQTQQARMQPAADAAPRAAPAAAAEPPPPDPAPTARQAPAAAAEPQRTAPGPTPSEKLLAEQVEYLRSQLDRRDRTIVEKDALIADLMQTLARLGRTAIKRINRAGDADEDLQEEFERDRRRQSEINERHERVLHNVTDVLASVRNHLARQKPSGGSDD